MISGFFASVHYMVICSEVLTNCHSMQRKIPETRRYCNGTYTKYRHSLAKWRMVVLLEGLVGGA